MRLFFLVFVVLSISACKSKSVMINDSSLSYSDAIAHHRAEYKEEFLKDERSPLREPDFEFMHFYEADSKFNCDCSYKLTPEAKPFQMSTVSGNVQIFTKHGIATCNINGTPTDVNVYASKRTTAIPGYEDYLFMPFKDITSGEETYGGGRYIDLRTGDIKNNRINIDFNKCYNPWCMYSEGYNCPIPPLENHFDVAILAGEKTWTGEKKH